MCTVKSVQSVKLKENDLLILRNLYQNREGLRVLTLMKLANLKRRNTYKRLNILRERGLIENIYPIWKIPNGQVEKCALLIKNDNIFELHNLSYVLKLIKVPDWWNKRKPRLERLKGWNFKNINFGKGGSNPYQQLINENFVIQTYPESIIIISRKRYYSNSPYETITEAINDVLDIITYFEERIKFKLFPSGIPALEIRNNDFNRLKDYMAEHCKKEGKKFLVEIDKNRKVWIDSSEPFGKEANYPEGQEILEKVTKDFLIKKPMLNSELQMMVQQVTSNQMMFAQNIDKHMNILEEMGNTLKKIQEKL
ncbi:hypothetical protein BMS3Abin17_00097 [archaeon BMS3Abin17]|nr:hypothetical protein BMS3Abin17_00097 [archaeon BMS3Abin17]